MFTKLFAVALTISLDFCILFFDWSGKVPSVCAFLIPADSFCGTYSILYGVWPWKATEHYDSLKPNSLSWTSWRLCP